MKSCFEPLVKDTCAHDPDAAGHRTLNSKHVFDQGNQIPERKERVRRLVRFITESIHRQTPLLPCTITTTTTTIIPFFVHSSLSQHHAKCLSNLLTHLMTLTDTHHATTKPQTQQAHDRCALEPPPKSLDSTRLGLTHRDATRRDGAETVANPSARRPRDGRQAAEFSLKLLVRMGERVGGARARGRHGVAAWRGVALLRCLGFARSAPQVEWFGC